MLAEQVQESVVRGSRADAFRDAFTMESSKRRSKQADTAYEGSNRAYGTLFNEEYAKKFLKAREDLLVLSCEELRSVCCELRDENCHLEQMVLVEEHGTLIKPLGPYTRAGKTRVNADCNFCCLDSDFLIPGRKRPSEL